VLRPETWYLLVVVTKGQHSMQEIQLHIYIYILLFICAIYFMQKKNKTKAANFSIMDQTHLL